MSETIYDYKEDLSKNTDWLLHITENEKYQDVCVGVQYGIEDLEQAAEKRKAISEDKIAEACDWVSVSWGEEGLTTADMLSIYDTGYERRLSVEKEYGLSPLNALEKREELLRDHEIIHTDTDDFSDAIAAISEPDSQLVQ